MEITKCLNEWNATIEALGQGKQTFLIRNYKTNLNEFILFPTFSYSYKEDYIQSFQNKYQNFVESNVVPKKDGKKIEVKYFAQVFKIIEKYSARIGSTKKYYIWTPQHVKSYLTTSKAQIWILRVYRLKHPVMSERTNGMRYSNLLKSVSLDGIEPVLNDTEFAKIVEKIEKIR